METKSRRHGKQSGGLESTGEAAARCTTLTPSVRVAQVQLLELSVVKYPSELAWGLSCTH